MDPDVQNPCENLEFHRYKTTQICDHHRYHTPEGSMHYHYRVWMRLPGFPLDYIALGIAWKCNTTALIKDLMDMYGKEGNERDRNLAQAIIGCILAMKGEDWDTSDSGSVEEFRERTRDVLQNSPRSC